MQQRDLLHGQTSAGEEENSLNSNSTELVEREMIGDTKIFVVGNEENGYFATYGRYRVSEVTKTKQETVEKVEKLNWEVVTAMMGAIADAVSKAHKTGELGE